MEICDAWQARGYNTCVRSTKVQSRILLQEAELEGVGRKDTAGEWCDWENLFRTQIRMQCSRIWGSRQKEVKDGGGGGGADSGGDCRFGGEDP